MQDWIKNWFPLEFDHVFISYLPNKDRHGKEFDVEPWETRALEIQAQLFRGATSYPSRGSYRSIDQGGNISSGVMIERTRMVISFVSEDALTEQGLKEITDYLKEFGQETGQETVAFVLDGEMYYIDIS